MKVIIPCAGRSTRFPNLRPKYMLTHPRGDMLVKMCISGIPVEPKDVIVTILQEHEDKYSIAKGISENMGSEVCVCALADPTRSQAETVYKTLTAVNVDEPFLVKDCDSFFYLPNPESKENYICTSDLQMYDEINPGNKSYVVFDRNGTVSDIIEKEVTGRFFSVGGYYFTSPTLFKNVFKKLFQQKRGGELYLSHIIQDMIKSNLATFKSRFISEYTDWGTVEQWHKYRKQFKTYFIDLDGIVFKNGAQYFKPRYEDVDPLLNNVQVIRDMSYNPHIDIIFITARPEKYRQLTENLLFKHGIKYKALLMGLMHSDRIIVNDFSESTRYPTCGAVNILRNSDDLKKYIGDKP